MLKKIRENNKDYVILYEYRFANSNNLYQDNINTITNKHSKYTIIVKAATDGSVFVLVADEITDANYSEIINNNVIPNKLSMHEIKRNKLKRARVHNYLKVNRLRKKKI